MDQLGTGTIVVCFIVYFLPAVIAALRLHPSNLGIFALNLFLGWTVLGWLIALIWSLSSTGRSSTGRVGNPRAERACPHCAEDIKRAALVCKHCGRDVEPLPKASWWPKREKKAV